MITADLLFLLLAVLLQASFATFLLLLAAKWKLIEWMQVHGNDFFAKMANCDLCLSWWINVVLTIIVFIAIGDTLLLSAPFFATAVTRKMI